MSEKNGHYAINMHSTIEFNLAKVLCLHIQYQQVWNDAPKKQNYTT